MLVVLVTMSVLGDPTDLMLALTDRSHPSASGPRKPQSLDLSFDRTLIQAIRKEGVAETHLDTLSLEYTPQLLAATASLIQTLAVSQVQETHRVDDLAGHCVHADSALIATEHSAILHWGLDERLLDLLEDYMGCPTALIGVALRKDSPNAQQVGTRLWHVDGEDAHVVKILIYLNDVRESDGPFEYVPKSCFNPQYRRLSWKYHRFWRYFCKNEDLEKIVPKNLWKTVIGDAGTMLIADTARVFHHGAIPGQTDETTTPARERMALIFAYTSQRPKDRELCLKFFPSADLLPAFAKQLSQRQQACLLDWRRSGD